MLNNRKLLPLIMLTLALLALLAAAGCDRHLAEPPAVQDPAEGDAEGLNGDPDASQPQEPPAPQPYTREATLMAVGDIMMHSPQINHGFNRETNRYEFDGYFTEVKDILSAGDWVIGNLEVPLAGKENGGFAGYPTFNAPEELADALKNAGFHLLSTANNHSLDRREIGVLNTLANLRERDLIPVGTAASEEEAEQIVMVTHNEITMAFLAYTYGTNGIPIPQGKDYLVNLIDEDKIARDIARAREEGADVVTVSMHWGHEYHRQPSAEQKRLAEHLVKAGADIILGSHPHVVQPYQTLSVTGYDGEERQGIVIYSMGNFISNQTRATMGRDYVDLGLIFALTVRKSFPDGAIEIIGPDNVFTWVHVYYTGTKRNYRILPVLEAAAATDDPLLTANDKAILNKYVQEMDQHIASLHEPAAASP